MYKVAVPEPDGSDIVVNLNTANDTIYFFDRALFNFSIEPQGREVLSYRVLVNGETIESGNFPGNVSFYVYASQVGSGYHTMKVEFTTKSGTKSLAEAYGMEIITVWKELVLDVDADVQVIDLVALDTLNGALTVKWQKYKNRNFHRYWLVKSCPTFNQGWNECQWIEFTNASDTTWTDPNYVGGSARFHLVLEAAATTLSTQPKDVYNVQRSTYTISGTNLTVKWNKPVMFETVEKVTLRRDNETLKETTDLTDTTFTEPYPFGLSSGSYTLTLHAANESFSYQYALGATCGEQFPRFTTLAYVPQEDKYIAQNTRNFVTYLSWFNTDYNITFEEQRWADHITSSPNGMHVYHSYADFLGDEIYRVDPDTYTTTLALDLTTKFGQVFINSQWFNRTLATFFAVSNNNWIAMQTTGGNHVINMNDGSVLSTTTTKAPIDISPDGDYLVNSNILYQWDGSSYQSILTLGSNVMWAAFREDETDQLLTIHFDGFIRAYRISDRSLLWEIRPSIPNLGNSDDGTYDPVSKRIMTAGYLINVETQTFRPIPYFGWYTDLRLANGKIFITSGRSVTVDFIEAIP